MSNLIKTALALLPKNSLEPVIESIGDTLIAKYGEKFEHRSKLFDHAAHNGSNYLHGHCFVSLELSLPHQDASGCRYLSFPLAYRMWNKVETKLELQLPWSDRP